MKLERVTASCIQLAKPEQFSLSSEGLNMRYYPSLPRSMVLSFRFVSFRFAFCVNFQLYSCTRSMDPCCPLGLGFPPISWILPLLFMEPVLAWYYDIYMTIRLASLDSLPYHGITTS